MSDSVNDRTPEQHALSIPISRRVPEGGRGVYNAHYRTDGHRLNDNRYNLRSDRRSTGRSFGGGIVGGPVCHPELDPNACTCFGRSAGLFTMYQIRWSLPALTLAFLSK